MSSLLCTRMGTSRRDEGWPSTAWRTRFCRSAFWTSWCALSTTWRWPGSPASRSAISSQGASKSKLCRNFSERYSILLCFRTNHGDTHRVGWGLRLGHFCSIVTFTSTLYVIVTMSIIPEQSPLDFNNPNKSHFFSLANFPNSIVNFCALSAYWEELTVLLSHCLLPSYLLVAVIVET